MSSSCRAVWPDQREDTFPRSPQPARLTVRAQWRLMAPTRSLSVKLSLRASTTSRFDDEPLRGLFEESASKGAARLSRAGDHRSDSRSNREQSVVYERRDDPVGSVGIDLELLAQRTHGGECVAGAKLFGHDRAGDRVDDLLVDGDARAQRDRERKHDL